MPPINRTPPSWDQDRGSGAANAAPSSVLYAHTEALGKLTATLVETAARLQESLDRHLGREPEPPSKAPATAPRDGAAPTREVLADRITDLEQAVEEVRHQSDRLSRL